MYIHACVVYVCVCVCVCVDSLAMPLQFTNENV